MSDLSSNTKLAEKLDQLDYCRRWLLGEVDKGRWSKEQIAESVADVLAYFRAAHEPSGEAYELKRLIAAYINSRDAGLASAVAQNVADMRNVAREFDRLPAMVSTRHGSPAGEAVAIDPAGRLSQPPSDARDAARYRFMRGEGAEEAQLVWRLAKHPEMTLESMDREVDAAIQRASVTKEAPPSDRLPDATPAHTCGDGIVRIGTREGCGVCYPRLPQMVAQQAERIRNGLDERYPHTAGETSAVCGSPLWVGVGNVESDAKCILPADHDVPCDYASSSE